MTPQLNAMPWLTKPLGEVVEILDRFRVPVSARERAERPGDVPYYGAAGQVGTINDKLFDEPLVLLGEDGVAFFDPLAPKAYLIDGPAWVNNHAHVLRPEDGIDRRFLMHWLNTVDYRGFANGTTRLKLTQAAMRRLPVPVPPLEEQRAIVDAIERMLSHLDTAVATVSAARRRLDLLQAAVDRHATYGRLHNVKGDPSEALAVVAACRGNRDPESILRAPLPEDVTLPETWVWSCIDELADVQAGAAKSKKLDQADGCVERPYLSVANVQRGHLSLDDVKSMWVRASKLDDLTLRPGDVLFNEGGDKDKLGRGWIWEGQIEGCVHQNHVFRARLRDEGVDPRWLSHWGNVFGRWWFHARGSQTTGIASINKSVLRSLPVPVPPPVEQQAILEELDRRGTGIGHANRTIDTATQRAEALRRSVLKAAFDGRLLQQAGAAPSESQLEEAIA